MEDRRDLHTEDRQDLHMEDRQDPHMEDNPPIDRSCFSIT